MLFRSKTGKLTIRPYSVVHSLIFDPGTRKVTGVRVIDGQTKSALEFKSRIVFLNAATLESTRILLNSATPEFPNGLANSSGELGHNLMDHHFRAGAEGMIGASAEVVADFTGRGKVRYGGELWNARSDRPLHAGDLARIVKVEGLTLWIEPQ